MKGNPPIIISDNNWKGKKVKKELVNSLVIEVGNRTVQELIENNRNLLIFPSSEKKFLDKIDSEVVFSSTEFNDSYLLKTGNIMGYVGCGGQELTIKSRFSGSGKDYFFHYLLKKVCNINIFDLRHGETKDQIFDFLPYLFPYYLNEALKQGIYKEYQSKNNNDSNVKGVIDIDKHIKMNIPFNGKIAYRIREFCYDNSVTELVRHTIEFIREKNAYKGVLEKDEITKKSVDLIISCTPLYDEKKRRYVILQNRKPIKSPYFSKYINLQNICRMILLKEKIKYSQDDNKIYGILFDGAWLWEEYLATILREKGYKHPENKLKKGGIYLFKNSSEIMDIEGNICRTSKCSRYPDFYKPRINNDKTAGSLVILDAKYKHLESGRIDRDDMHQIISYMHVEHSDFGGYIYPFEGNGEKMLFHRLGELRGPWGGRIFTMGIPCGFEESNYKNFINKMKKNEAQLKEISGAIEVYWDSAK